MSEDGGIGTIKWRGTNGYYGSYTFRQQYNTIRSKISNLTINFINDLTDPGKRGGASQVFDNMTY